jgi:hypothetical protein
MNCSHPVKKILETLFPVFWIVLTAGKKETDYIDHYALKLV